MEAALAAVRRRMLDEYLGDGRWSNHFGDATAWAAAFLLDAKDASGAEAEAARATLARERKLLAHVPRGAEREEAALGVLALVASARAGGVLDRAAAQAIVTGGNAAAAARGGYLDKPAATFDPTSVTAALAYGNLLLASALHGPARIVHGRVAQWLLDRLDARVFVERNAYYQARPGDGRVEALPNLLVAAALARASRLRRERGLLERAERVEASLRSSLWDGDAGAWLTTEEAEPVYFLSVQNFAALMYAEMHWAAPRGPWRERGRECLRFATRRLLAKDVLLHDWHPETGPSSTHCTGCNWQTLYVADALERGRPRL